MIGCSKLTRTRQCRIIEIEAHSYVRAAAFGTAKLGRGAVGGGRAAGILMLLLNARVDGGGGGERYGRGAGRGCLPAVRVGGVAEDAYLKGGMFWGAGGWEGVKIRCHGETEVVWRSLNRSRVIVELERYLIKVKLSC